MLVLARLGLDPWDVLHQGLARTFGLQIGTWTVIVSVLVLLAWIPLRQRPGVGTICNAVLVGLVMDVVLGAVHPPHALGVRWALLVGGVAANGVATGLYIGAGLGPGPRDGLSVGIAGRGHSMRVVRTTIEGTVLVTGFLLGGAVGVGTVLYALSIGPITHHTIPALAISGAPSGPTRSRRPARPGLSPEPSPSAPAALSGCAGVRAADPGLEPTARGYARYVFTPFGKLRVEQEPTGRRELREVRQRAPADEQVPVGRRLRIALGGRDEPFGLVVRRDQRRRAVTLIQPDRDGPTRRELRRPRRLVVEQRVGVVPERLRVVLPGEDLAGVVQRLEKSPATSSKLESLPPSCQMTMPVWRLTLYVVHVSRASISRLPSVSICTALTWNQSHGVLGDVGSGCSLWLYGT